MRRSTLFAALTIITAPGFALEANDKASAWLSATATERADWASRAIEEAHGVPSPGLTRGALSACLDSNLRRSAPSSDTDATLAEATARCKAIKNR
jgi:hypothetical protein